jgi:ABC-type uncharacterized transport system auxiliary subunit
MTLLSRKLSRKWQIRGIILILLFIIGCASNSNNKTIQGYALQFVSNEHPILKVDYDFIKVDIPNFSSKHNTESIIYTNNAFELDRYSQSEWIDPLPLLLQEWFLQSFENSHLFKGVMRATSRAKVSLFLESDIIKFQHNVKNNVVEVSLRLTLLDYKSRKIVKHKIFNYQQSVAHSSAKDAVIAFNEVLIQLDKDIYSWLVD